MKKQTKIKKLSIIDHDTHWKELIMKLFEEFVAFFLPHIHPLVDWTKPYEMLDQELHKIVADKFKGDHVIDDKLFKVYMKAGDEKWILLHLELQSSVKPTFMERMFVYFHRIFDSRGKVITALALLTGDSLPKNYNRYEYNLLGTKLVYEFNTYCVKHANEEELLKSDNPFALAILAAIYVNRSKKKGELRYEYKLKLVELLQQKEYSDEQIDALLQFIYLLLVLPEKMEQKFEDEINEIYNLNEKSMDAATEKKMTRFADKLFKAIYGESATEQLARERQEAAEQLAHERQKAAEQLRREKQEAAEQLRREKQEAAEQLRREKQEVAEKTVEKLLKIANFPIEEIADIVGLTHQEVLDIQAKINGN